MWQLFPKFLTVSFLKLISYVIHIAVKLLLTIVLNLQMATLINSI